MPVPDTAPDPRSGTGVRRSLPFRPDIEGLRGLAVLLVVGYHAGMPGVGGGFIGVDVFFVLSGYLITAILTREIEASGGIRLARFYARRVRRLLPAAAVLVLFTLVVGTLLQPPHVQRELAKTAGAAGAYVSNFWLAWQVGDYFGSGAEADPLLHMWSLSVEEQFYLVWPVLLLAAFAGRVSRRRVALVMTAVILVSFAGSWWYAIVSRPRAFFLAPYRAWEFAAGGLLSLAPATHKLRPVLVRGVGAVGLALVVGSAVVLSAADPFPGSAAVPVVAGTVLVLWPGHVSGPTPRVLGLGSMQRIGTLSYSWYLWHWPVLVYFGLLVPGAGWPVRLAVAVAALAPAAAVYRWIEDPLRRHRWLSVRPARSLAFGVAVTAGVVLLSGAGHLLSRGAAESPAYRAISVAAERDPLAKSGCVASLKEDRVRECAFGAQTGPVVALVGDSHAAHWSAGLVTAVGERRARLVVMAKGGCPTTEVIVEQPKLGRTYRECERWRDEVVERLRALAPDVLLVANSSGYTGSGLIHGPDEPYGAWEDGLRAFLGRVAPAAGTVMLIQDTPRFLWEIPTCLAMAARPFRSRNTCSRPRAEALDARLAALQRRVARSLPNVRTIDLSDRLCTEDECPAVVDGVIAYRDGHHISTAMSERLAGPWSAILAAALTDSRMAVATGSAAGS